MHDTPPPSVRQTPAAAGPETRASCFTPGTATAALHLSTTPNTSNWNGYFFTEAWNPAVKSASRAAFRSTSLPLTSNVLAFLSELTVVTPSTFLSALFGGAP